MAYSSTPESHVGSTLLDVTPAPLPPGAFSASRRAASAKPKSDWWYSADGKRGFCWDAVVGWDYRSGGNGGQVLGTLYVYTLGGLVHLHGSEASAVAERLIEQSGRAQPKVAKPAVSGPLTRPEISPSP